jgi:uncharacterized protein YccT (UPF0319 family)
MSVHNFSNGSLKHKTAADIKTPEIRKLVEESPSINTLTVIGNEMCRALLLSKDENVNNQIIHDLMVLFSIIQSKSSDVRLMCNQLKTMLNIKGDLNL